MIKSIETRYAGCRFRSRLEARWAVAFDHLKIEWQYEPEGFELSSGLYLPDFYLPGYGRTVHTIRESGVWVEIKGRPATFAEQVTAVELQRERREPVYFLAGDVPREHTYVCSRSTQALEGDVFAGHLWSGHPAFTGQCLLHGDVDGALTAARSARFEHGERG